MFQKMEGAGPKKMLYVGGLAEEVDQKVLQAAFVPFGDIVEVNMPIDYETEKHRGFAFIEFELQEDAQVEVLEMSHSLKTKSKGIECVERDNSNFIG